MSKQFTKPAMLDYLTAMALDIQTEHGFVGNIGSQQVEGRPTALQVEYGKFRACLDLIEAINGGYIGEA